MGQLSSMLLDSINAVPEQLETSGYDFSDRDVQAILATALA